MNHRVRTAWRVLGAEGAAGVRDRTLDHLAEAARRRSFAPMPPDWRPEVPIPVLLVTSAPPAPWLGGVPAQLRTRLETESRARSTALLYPQGGVWRLEVVVEAERWFLEMPGAAPSPVALDDAPFKAAVHRAAERVGARAVHVEGLAGLPPASLLYVGQSGLTLILAVHDFAAFCLRPHLAEEPGQRFCHYSTDLDRCGRCLEHDWPANGAFQATRRGFAGDLLGAAAAVVFPSDFLRRTHAELFPGQGSRGWRVLEPPIASTAALPRSAPGPLRHVALVGSVQAHKGARIFAETVRRLSGAGLRWSAYGGGDAERLRELRRLGVRVRGYYRHGSLPGRLRRDGVDLALLLSIVPESHNLVLSECVVAGVPVLAFALGAVADRVPALEAGRLIPLEAGVDGVVAALEDFQRDGLPVVPEEAARRLVDPVSAAAGWLAVYRELGLYS